MSLGLAQVQAEFALSGSHAGEGRELAGLLELEEGLAVGFGGEVVEDLDAFGGLLQSEVAHVGDEDDEFLLVVRAAQGFSGGLDDDDAGSFGGLLGQGAGAVGVAVVGDVDPTAGSEVGSFGGVGGDLLLEGGHRWGLMYRRRMETVWVSGLCGGWKFRPCSCSRGSRARCRFRRCR